jgi:hypothetical protein
VYSVTGSGHFQGCARVIGDITDSPTKNIKWIQRAQLAFKDTSDLLNPFNGNWPVHRGRGGQVMLT